MASFAFDLNKIYQSVETLNIHKYLRRHFVEQLVVLLRYALMALALLLLILTVREYFRSSVDTSTKIQKFENDLDAAIAALPKPQSSSTRGNDYSIIVNKSLFGKIGVAAPPPPVVNQKPTNVTPLLLIGTFITPGEPPYAIIEDGKKKNQEMFGLNDSVFEEAKLTKILSDRVEIVRAGKTEVLLLDSTDGASESGGSSAESSDEFSVDEAELDRALENLPLLLTQARAVPFFKEGRAIGLRLFAIKTGSLFEKLGLQNGDVLKSVNGNSLGDLSQAMQLFQKLKEEKNIAVTLERNLTERTFRYQIR